MAHWIIEDKGFDGQVYTCSHCKNSWDDLYHPTVGQWDICPWCHNKIEEGQVMSDSKKYEEAMNKLKEAMDKLMIPRLCSSSVDTVRAFNYSLLEAKVNTLEQLSGMTLDDILAKFAAGWVLKEPPMTYLMDSNYKFDTELLRLPIEELEKKRNSEWPYWGRCEFEKRQGEESLKDMMRRAGYLNAGEPVICESLVVNIDFDKKPEESEE